MRPGPRVDDCRTRRTNSAKRRRSRNCPVERRTRPMMFGLGKSETNRRINRREEGTSSAACGARTGDRRWTNRRIGEELARCAGRGNSGRHARPANSMYPWAAGISKGNPTGQCQDRTPRSPSTAIPCKDTSRERSVSMDSNRSCDSGRVRVRNRTDREFVWPAAPDSMPIPKAWPRSSRASAPQAAPAQAEERPQTGTSCRPHTAKCDRNTLYRE
jgi:hypothetical protein